MTLKTPAATDVAAAAGQDPVAGSPPRLAAGQEAAAGTLVEGRPGSGGQVDAAREELILSALDDAAEYRRRNADCEDCELIVGQVKLCDSHARDEELAAAYDREYLRRLGELGGEAAI